MGRAALSLINLTIGSAETIAKATRVTVPAGGIEWCTGLAVPKRDCVRLIRCDWKASMRILGSKIERVVNRRCFLPLHDNFHIKFGRRIPRLLFFCCRAVRKDRCLLQ
jgi:hypothetical protein